MLFYALAEFGCVRESNAANARWPGFGLWLLHSGVLAKLPVGMQVVIGRSDGDRSSGALESDDDWCIVDRDVKWMWM